MPECQLCGAPGGYPYCNADCEAADQVGIWDEMPEHDVNFTSSGLAPLRVVRAVKEMLPSAIAAVEAHMGETVPPLTITIAGPHGMAAARLLTIKDQHTTWRQLARYWKQSLFYDCKSAVGVTAVTRGDRVFIGLNGPKLRWAPREIWSTLIHELVHAVQAGRPGRRVEELARLDHALEVADLAAGHLWASEAVEAIEEAEAYAVERVLAPGSSEDPGFDRTAMFRRMVDAVSHWEAAERPVPELVWDEAA